ncbi:arylsulfatase [Parastagonospora nodorum]|nr:arylsulfatase [Parastagonospora nodorum]KAH4391762.1 arylsulfatase [Parastagonospora nodorum]KAH4392461.1 arylsulfatase [Parastagonospora nodorum]KAH5133460.1 arylsulfatase [Parastagonospora nodorum]KAH5312410.1 arylsulfatase [Parastagonospora nodorum]
MLSFSILWKLCLLWSASTTIATSSTRHGKPNFVFIITDDQDLHLGSMDYMPLTRKQLGKQGTFYKQHYCTISICCPSRVSLLTGKAAHNTNVTDVNPPYGGYTKFISQGLNDKYLPVFLQGAGYDTYYTGKLMNGHSTTTWNKPLPAGWNGTDFLVDPGTYIYWNATFQKDQAPPAPAPGQYNTDLVKEKGLEFIDTVANTSKPFFIGIAPIGPHAEFNGTGGFTKAVGAKRHQKLFLDAKAPRTSNWNPDKPSGASWISKLEKLNGTVIASHDEWHVGRLQSLQSVDELVDEVVNRLEKYKLLDNTYIIFTSDNGYHIGQHRLQPGKTCAFEEDINVPFYVRGPNVPKGKTVDVVTTHTDIVPTLFELAGIEQRDDFDGQPIPVTSKAIAEQLKKKKRDHVNVEFWGPGRGEGTYGVNVPNNTYKAVRIIGERYNLLYTVWCTNEHELYDMTKDPGQVNNLVNPSKQPTLVLNQPISRLQSRLDALLLVLKTCKASSCTDPWPVIHPKGDVVNLEDALASKFDDFYAQQPKVAFTKCELGQILSSEGPQVGNSYHGSELWPNWA